MNSKSKLPSLILSLFSLVFLILLIVNLLNSDLTSFEFFGFGNFIDIISKCPNLLTSFNNFSSTLESFKMSIPEILGGLKVLITFFQLVVFVSGALLQIITFILYFAKFFFGF